MADAVARTEPRLSLDPRTLRALEYEKVRRLLAEQASGALGKEKALALEPTTGLEAARTRQAETEEARVILRLQKRVPLGGVHDIRDRVRAAAKGAALEPSDLLDVADTVAAGRQVRGLLLTQRVNAPRLAERAQRIGDFRELEEAVGACIGPRSELYDHASPALQEVRVRLRTLHDTVLRRLETIMRSPQYSRMVQEPIVTLRSDRFCIPIRREYKGEFPGLLLDSSGSGATVFMEPFAAVEVNNQLRESRRQEEEEVRKILLRLSGRVGERQEQILATLDILAVLDLLFACARLAEAQNATQPELGRDGAIDLKQARHPFLTGEVVPIDVRLGEEFTGLIITGPNTGGKTVTLRTIGLLTLMAQSGLHIPAAPGSRLAVFDQVFADIGDEQSIEQSLSTFSSHMTQIVRVIGEAGPRALALLDEIGAGTDPAEGSALAKAVLSELVRREVRVVATTHYGELKAYAYSQPRVENASVEFDPISLRPTYKVRIGLPGSSNAFAIASRLGLPSELLAAAAETMGEEQVALEKIIRRVEADSRSLAAEQGAAQEVRRGLETAKSEFERRVREVKERRREALQDARAEAQRIVRRARLRAEELLALLRQTVQQAKEEEQARLAEEARRAWESIAEIAQEAETALEAAEPELPSAETAEETAPEPPPPLPLASVSRGEVVHVRSVDQRGIVLGPADTEGYVEIQVGLLRLRSSLSDLERVDVPAVTLSIESPMSVPTEIHLRGLRVDEALYELERYLDEAILARLPQVRIVHGSGTGAIRRATHEFLRQHPRVRSFRHAEPREGGGGATIAELES